MGKYIDIPVKYIVLSCIGSTHTLRAAALPRDVSPHLPLQLATGGELIDPVTPKWGDFGEKRPPFLLLKQQASLYWEASLKAAFGAGGKRSVSCFSNKRHFCILGSLTHGCL